MSKSVQDGEELFRKIEKEYDEAEIPLSYSFTDYYRKVVDGNLKGKIVIERKWLEELATKYRDWLYAKGAEENAPCKIFIDEFIETALLGKTRRK